MLLSSAQAIAETLLSDQNSVTDLCDFSIVDFRKDAVFSPRLLIVREGEAESTGKRNTELKNATLKCDKNAGIENVKLENVGGKMHGWKTSVSGLLL